MRPGHLCLLPSLSAKFSGVSGRCERSAFGRRFGSDNRGRSSHIERRVFQRDRGGRSFVAVLLALAACGCEPDLVVGTWSCPAEAREKDDAGVPTSTVTGPIEAPWSTGFEQGLCDYNLAGGFCYSHSVASYTLVDSPVHSGKQAMAFSIDLDAPDDVHARCVREGTLPEDAVYGAWYYVPSIPESSDNWNLFHIQAGEVGGTLRTIWDVNLSVTDDGSLALYLFGVYGFGAQPETQTRMIPIGAWFHIEFRLRRAADTTGAVGLYQDGIALVEKSGIRTDDTTFQQWYVGNLARALTPAASTLYVDDITIRPAP